MIDRYTTPEMAQIWSEQNKFETWKKVEITVTEVLSDRGEVPKEAVKVINEKAAFTVERILEIEKVTRHDVIAFLTNMAENIGPESRFIHMGMTSSDLLDTSLALLCQKAGEIILGKLKTFKEVLRTQAVTHRESYQIGRSHGVHAEPITFGLKLALWSEEIGRHIVRWERAVKSIATGKISGAVGTYQHLDPEVEEEACKRLGLQAATVSSQVVQRDHHAEYLTSLANMAASLEKIAVEIRHLQRTEVLEAEEYFHYYAVENADLDAVENLIEGRGLKKPGVSEEFLKGARVRAAAGNGAMPIVGNPDEVVATMKRLSDYGISALAMGFTNYLDHFPYFRDEVLPRLVSEGLRVE